MENGQRFQFVDIGSLRGMMTTLKAFRELKNNYLFAGFWQPKNKKERSK
jgi:hypothetical protein